MSKLNNQLYEVNNQRQRGNYSPNLVYLPYSGDTIGGKEQGGGGPMDPKYVTKEELKTLETKIDGQFNTLNATIKGGFDTAKAETETRFAELEAKQTKWFVVTAIAIIGLVVTLVKLI